MLEKAVHGLIPALGIWKQHAVAFGKSRGSWFYALQFAVPSAAGRRVTTKIPGSDIPLTLRLKTSDVSVFHEIFVQYEYDWGLSGSPQVILDVGGYIGLSAAYFASKYPEAKIIAVEPDGQNFELLKLNTAHFPNVQAVNAAIWRENGMISLTDPGTGFWGLQVTEAQGASASDAGLVRATTIDEIIKEFSLEKIDLLKIDVEGSEVEIFETADSWISSVDTICIELHDRFKVGCSRTFFKAVDEFPIELRRNEDVLVTRPGARLAPI